MGRNFGGFEASDERAIYAVAERGAWFRANNPNRRRLRMIDYDDYLTYQKDPGLRCDHILLFSVPGSAPSGRSAPRPTEHAWFIELKASQVKDAFDQIVATVLRLRTERDALFRRPVRCRGFVALQSSGGLASTAIQLLITRAKRVLPIEVIREQAIP